LASLVAREPEHGFQEALASAIPAGPTPIFRGFFHALTGKRDINCNRSLAASSPLPVHGFVAA
jgi:hypothetical protein